MDSALETAIRHTAICQVEEVYERTPLNAEYPDAEERDPDRPRRLASVAAAYHSSASTTGGPLLLGWCRPAEGAPVTVLTSAVAAATGAGTAILTFPPGSRGRPYPGSDAITMLASVPSWTRLGAAVDGLLVDDIAAGHDAGARPGLVDGLLAAWHAAFAWLLVAEPVPPAEVNTEAGHVAARERDARSRTSSPEYAVLATRLERRHRELRAAESTGLWRVHLLAGGADHGSARAVAGLLAAATDLTGLPYALVPGVPTGDLAAVLAASAPTTPFLAGSPLVAALARPPTVEIPGVRLIPRPTFDVTPETGPEPGSLDLGHVVDRNGVPAGRVRLPTSSLNRHTFVCGATGGGKSQTIRHLLAEATAAGVPWLVIEPAKAEYRRMAARLPGTEVIALRPGDPLSPPVGFNPLAPAPGFPLQTHADLTRALFVAAFQAEEPFPQVLAAALTRSYEQLGWDLTLSEPAFSGVRPRYPTLEDLQTAAIDVIESIGYGREVTDNVRGFIGVRLSSLRLGTTGQFFESGQRLDLALLLNRNVILEIEDVGDDRDKAFLMGAVLIQLVEHLRARDRVKPHVGGLRHLTVIEEAHRLLRRPDHPGPAAHAVELFAALLAEVRAYGEGLVIAEQIPAKLVPDVIKNTAIKIVHRLPARDDRDAVGATMNVTDAQSRFLVTLSPGTGAVFTDGMDHPVLATIPDGTATELAEARIASPASLIATPGPTCTRVCAEQPCTLQQISATRRMLRGDPRLVIWAELAVLGHLVGLPAPTPKDQFAGTLVDLDTRLLGCALRHGVEAAVAVRSAALSSSHSPDGLATHVVNELRGWPDDSGQCTDEARAWLAPCFRWNPVRLALQDLHAHDPAAGRHPDSERWESTYGEPINGDSCREQLGTVRRRSIELLRDRPAVDAIVFGSGSPSAIEQAVGQSRETADWPAALDRAVHDLVVSRRWPAAFLAPRPGRSR